MVVVKFLVFVSEVVSIFSQILTWIIGGERIPLPHQLNYWGSACPPKSTPMCALAALLNNQPRHWYRVVKNIGGNNILKEWVAITDKIQHNTTFIYNAP